MEENSQFHTPDALPPGKGPRYRLYTRIGGPQSRYGRGGELKNIPHCLCRELNPGRPARTYCPVFKHINSHVSMEI